MNEQPQPRWKVILHRIWNEPRHFFFWLTFIGLLAVPAFLIAATLGREAVNLFTAWGTLAALFCLLIGATAFVLAWIPPVRRLFASLLQHKLLCLITVITLVALFYAVENWRGRTAWNQFKNEAQTRSIYFDADKIVPSEISIEANMFEASPWTDLHWQRSEANGVVFQNTNTSSENWFDISGPNHSAASKRSDLFTGKRISLVDWQTFYRGSNNLFATQDGGSTNFFPVAAIPQSPARDVLLALGRYDERLNQLRTAAQRPQARFWINYEDGFNALLPHLAKVKGTVQYLQLRAIALLADGQTDAALQDLKLAFRITRAIGDEATLISQLVAIASMHNNLATVWEGLADHRWNEAQLVVLEQELAQMDFLTSFHRGMDGERYCSILTMDYVRRYRNRADLYQLFETESSDGDALSMQLERAAGKIIFRLAPSGWFEQNKLSLGIMHTEFIHPQVDLKQRTINPAVIRRGASVIKIRAQHQSPYDLFSGMLLPALDKAAKKFAIAQSYLDLARVAIALERHRIAAGNYPEDLTALTPKFLDKIPHDVITGQPLKYQRSDNGSFLLYSVGWNETDEGGKIVMRTGKDGKEGTSVDQDRGDWVWRYPAN